jgi:hypothetical protein
VSEDGNTEDAGFLHSFGEASSWFGKAHTGVEAIEGMNATQEVVDKGGTPTLESTFEQAQEGAESGGESLFGAVGQALAPFALASGVIEGDEQFEDAHKHGWNLDNSKKLGEAGLETTAGGIGTLGTAGTMLSAAGATSAGAGATAAAAAAAPVAMVAGAAGGGMAMGDWMGKTADSDATRTGVWGKDDGGKNKSAMDWGSGWGTWVDTHIGDKNAADPSILGGIAAGAGGIIGGIAGTAQAHPLLAQLAMMP